MFTKVQITHLKVILLGYPEIIYFNTSCFLKFMPKTNSDKTLKLSLFKKFKNLPTSKCE